MSTPSPLRFSHYRVLEREDGSAWVLGTGSMGVTYKAYDERLRLEVALKVIAPERVHSGTAQALFLREARAAARVRHGNVASILALDDTPGRLFYAMEFVPGITLQALIADRGALPPAVAAHLALQAARGLEAIHRQGLLHRDLKPANLMLLPLGEPAGGWEVKVIDFGLAHAVEGGAADAFTAVPMKGFLGTVLYASPEQCLERDVDARADLYSLGCILFEMLVGRPPFAGRSHYEIMAKQISAPVPAALLAPVPEPLRGIVSALLAKEPEDRPPDAATLARELDEAHRILAVGGTSSGGTSFAGGTRGSSRSSGLMMKGIAVLALANLSPERADEYFSDGIADELINALSKIPGFRVAARASSFSFKGKNVPLPEIARQLAVDYVVDGSVRRGGDRVRISVQLVSAEDGFPMWSDTFERELRDVFAVQDEIAGIVAKNLQLKLARPHSEARPVDPEAFRLYLEGRQALSLRSPEAMERGEAALRKALVIDPGFPRAMGALAHLLVLQADLDFLNQGSWASASTLRDQADQLADEAIALDPAEAEAISSRGMTAWSRGDMPEAIRLIRAALALNPSAAGSHQLLSRALGANGELEESLRHARQAFTLDPLSARISDNCAMTMLFAGLHAEALTMAERSIARVPDDPQVLAWKAWALSGLGRREEAVEAARDVVRRGGSWVYYVACTVLREAGLGEEAEIVAAKAGTGPVMSRVFAEASMGRAASVLDLVPRQLGAMFFEELLYPSMWHPVRMTEAWARLMEDLGLSEAHARAMAWREKRAARPATVA